MPPDYPYRCVPFARGTLAFNASWTLSYPRIASFFKDPPLLNYNYIAITNLAASFLQILHASLGQILCITAIIIFKYYNYTNIYYIYSKLCIRRAQVNIF